MENLHEIKRLQKLAGINPQQLNEGWKDLALGAAMTGASLFGGDKAQAQTQDQDKPQAVQATSQGSFQSYLTQIVKNPQAFLDQLKSNKGVALDYLSTYSENEQENQKALMKAKLEYAFTKQPVEYTVKDSAGKTVDTKEVSSAKEYEAFISDIKEQNKKRKEAGQESLTVSSNLSSIEDPGLSAINNIISSTIRGTSSF